jgi:CRISPR/Cas system-associated protein Cas10 (large subunit of type III CRISPR-Cas system)
MNYRCPFCKRDINVDAEELEAYIQCPLCAELMANPYSVKEKGSDRSYIG